MTPSTCCVTLGVFASMWIGFAPTAHAQSTSTPTISRQQRQSFYDEAKLERSTALLYSLALPGLGNFYTEQHFSGVLLMSIFGLGAVGLIMGLATDRSDATLIGTTLIVGTHATGAWMSWRGVAQYNDLLRQRYDLKQQATGPMLQWAWQF